MNKSKFVQQLKKFFNIFTKNKKNEIQNNPTITIFTVYR